MMTKRRLLSGSQLLLATCCIACATQETPPNVGSGTESQTVASEDVEPVLAERLRTAAETHPDMRPTLAAARVVYIGVEAVRWKTDDGEEDSRPLFRVIHYRYDDDAAIYSVVDSEASAVVDRQVVPHGAAPLGEEELEEAKRIALNDTRVREILGEYVDRVEVEPLVIRTASPDDPWFGRRVVRLLFRVERDYISSEIVVDLTNRSVATATAGGLER